MTYHDIDVTAVVQIALRAGEEIMKIYARDFTIETKADQSPLTEADKVSNRIIVDHLQQLYPDVPLISEETRLTPYATRQTWKRFWLIDPIDGTKEFIKRNGEFTVNIALIEEGEPVLGIVYAPALSKCYVGVKGQGSFLFTPSGQSYSPIRAGAHYTSLNRVRVVASRSHLNEETIGFVDQLKASGKEVHFVSSGSSLKFCLVAEGAADVYPRFGPTMEWDTGAAHAVALYAGKQVIAVKTRQPLRYNKEDLLNPWFVVE